MKNLAEPIPVNLKSCYISSGHLVDWLFGSACLKLKSHGIGLARYERFKDDITVLMLGSRDPISEWGTCG
jgi:hypothetical protein